MSDQDHGHSSPNLIKDEDVTMKIQHVLAIATLFTLNNGVATAGETISETGALACVTDKWDEKELEKGHKLVDYASRCIIIPDEAASPKVTESCAASLSTWRMAVGREAGPAPTPISRVAPRQSAGKRAHISKNTSTRSPAAPANSRAPQEVEPICTKT